MRRCASAVAFTVGLCLAACTSAPDEELLAVAGATVYPSPTEPAIVDGVVILRDGVISELGPRSEISVPSAATVLEADGKHLVAGFQNSHVHFTEPGWTGSPDAPAEELSLLLDRLLLRHGFTTVVDTGSDLQSTLALRNRIESGEVRGPRILTAGSPLYPSDGIPFYLKTTLPPEMLAELPTPATPEEAVAIVAQQIEAGADLVKLFVGSWVERGRVLPMPVEIARAAAREAHSRGRLVFAHASNIPGLEIALEADVDVLAHALDDDRGWDQSFVSRMTATEMAMIPTLKLFSGQPYTKYIVLEVRDYFDAGGPILFGTDVGFLSDDDPTDEYRLMADSGIDWRSLLASLTTTAAERFGESELRGRIAAGLAGDLVLLDESPSQGPAAFSTVRATIRAGRIVYQRVE